MKLFRTIWCALLLCLWQGTFAEIPDGYYDSATGKKAADLKTQLWRIIKDHTNIGYDGLWTAYKTTDKRADGKLRDWYSNTTNYVIGGSQQGKNYSKEGDSYNREHTVPQSWFKEASPMKADAFHVVPTDGYVNNRRSSYPFGEVSSTTYKSNNNYCRLGSCKTSGYSGTVFEPADEIKGDIARIYFYMVTCYEDKCTSWSGGIFTSSKYPGLVNWTLQMMLRWSAEDPVDATEMARNEAVFELQGNRNPYVDYPGLEQHVWGNKTTEAFDPYTMDVEQIEVGTVDDDNYYNLAGQKVNAVEHGIYIYRGKKVLK